MSDTVSRPSVPSPLPDRERALDDLAVCWDLIRATSSAVQDLDSPIVRFDLWGDRYADAQAFLDAAIARTYQWHSSPFPVEDRTLRSLEGFVRDELVATQRLVRAFEWSETQAVLFSTGTAVLVTAHFCGVELD